MNLQAGTLSGNPLAMTAGLKTLEILDRPGAYEHLEKVTGRLIEGILQAGRDAGHAVSGGHISGQPPAFAASVAASCAQYDATMFHSQIAASTRAALTVQCAMQHVSVSGCRTPASLNATVPARTYAWYKQQNSSLLDAILMYSCSLCAAMLGQHVYLSSCCSHYAAISQLQTCM